MRYLIILSLVFLFGCNSENASDCFQTSGAIVDEVYEVQDFNRIIVWDRVKLVLVEGPEKRVMVRTGENLLNEIKVRVEDSILKVSDRNSCNFVRDYSQPTTVYVTAPVDTLYVRNSSGLTVENIGRITNDRIHLISEDREEEDEFHTDGDFNLTNLDVQILVINANGNSTFRLQGKTWLGVFGLSDGDCRIEAEDLEVVRVELFHRSTNKIICSPRQSIKGKIVSVGDVICKIRPPEVDVEELYQGRLIFE
ncbi:MAG: DUF2807 domain-containing protein [Flavobacteriaceae bacterium]